MPNDSGLRISVKRDLGIPLATQLRDQLVAAISVGDLKVDEQLPPTRQLADFLGINRNTVGQAYRSLEREGYVTTRAGGGTVVAAGPAARSTRRAHQLRQLVQKALEEARAKGFGPEEFGQAAYYQGLQSAASHEVSVLVVDEYQGELDFLCKAVVENVEVGVHGMLLQEVERLVASDRAWELEGFDFALVPFYCLAQAREILSQAGLPVLGAGLGPSLSTLLRIAQVPREQRVTIVCTEPSGVDPMEAALEAAEIAFPQVRKASLRDSDLDEAVAWAELLIMSQGSVEQIRRMAPDKPTVAYSVTVDEASLATIRSYAEYVARRNAQGSRQQPRSAKRAPNVDGVGP